MISIIIPIYNAENTLTKCVNSVRSQTYTDWELILVDDGSTDQSGTLCDVFERKDKRIKVLHQFNGGPSKARNAGINRVQWEWITFIDADDWVENSYLQDMYNALEDSHILVMQRMTEEDGDKIHYTLPLERFSSPCTKLFCSEIIKREHILFPEDLTCGEDAVFNLQYCQYVNRIQEIEKYGYHRIIVPESLSQRNSNEALYKSIKALQTIYSQLDYIAKTPFYRDFVHSRIAIRYATILKRLYGENSKRQERLFWLKRLFYLKDLIIYYPKNYKSDTLVCFLLQKKQYIICDQIMKIMNQLRQKK